MLHQLQSMTVESPSDEGSCKYPSPKLHGARQHLVVFWLSIWPVSKITALLDSDDRLVRGLWRLW